MSLISRYCQAFRETGANCLTTCVGLAMAAIALVAPAGALAQFADLRKAENPVHEAAEGGAEPLPPGPAGPLLSQQFGVESEPVQLRPKSESPWKDSGSQWLEDGQFVTPTLFDGEAPPPRRSPVPHIGRIHTAQEWRAWRRRRRRWSDSWMFFPISITKFTGLQLTQEPIHEKISRGEGSPIGFRLGWDFAPRLGVESRLAFARQALRDNSIAGSLSHENFIFWDADLLVYPWGDRPWRPFLLTGIGLADVRYIDSSSVFWHQTLLAAPIGAGLQYRFNNRAAVRLDVIDNMLLRSAAGGGSRHLLHNLSITFGFEARFGRPHKSYFDSPHGALDRLKVFMPYHD